MERKDWGVIMKRFSFTIALTCLLALAQFQTARAQLLTDDIDRDRLAQAGMKFLSMSVGARAAAMGDALTAQEGSSLSMFYNPANMARMNSVTHASFGQVQWFSDITYNAGSVAFRPLDGTYGTFGLSLVSVNYGDFEETIRADNELGFRDVGTFSPSALAAGLGYARALSDQFSVGGHLKYAFQSLGASTMRLNEGGDPVRQDNQVGTVAADFGVLYRTGFRSLNFAVSVRNFSRELTYAEESFELPLTFRVGASMDMIDLTQLNSDMHSARLAIEAQRPRDYAEQIKAGLEYTFMDLLSLRGGYVFPHDERGINLGAGIQTDVGGVGFGFNYAYTELGVFGNINRFGLEFSL